MRSDFSLWERVALFAHPSKASGGAGVRAKSLNKLVDTIETHFPEMEVEEFHIESR
jgi:hypothetical protein